MNFWGQIPKPAKMSKICTFIICFRPEKLSRVALDVSTLKFSTSKINWLSRYHKMIEKIDPLGNGEKNYKMIKNFLRHMSRQGQGGYIQRSFYVWRPGAGHPMGGFVSSVDHYFMGVTISGIMWDFQNSLPFDKDFLRFM